MTPMEKAISRHPLQARGAADHAPPRLAHGGQTPAGAR
jgi:hypothetical protein